VLPNSVEFGDQQVSTVSSAQQVTVSNTSNGQIALTSESVTGPFAIQINSCSATLDASTGCTLAIVFQPTQSGPATGTLTIVSGQGTQTIGLSGNGETGATDTLAPMALSFPATLENTASAPQIVTLTNSGGAPLTGIQVQTNGDFAVVSGCNYSLNAQSSCTLTVRYTPHAAGAETGSITVTDALRIQTVSLSGTGLVPPTDTLSPAALIFPATVIGQSAPPQTVTLTNSGDSALNQLSIQAIGAGFGESNTCGGTLAAHASCVITATFQALSPGNAAGQIDVADALRTQVISLSGSGQTPAQDNLSPLSIHFGPQTVGTVSAAQTVTLSNNGQAALAGIRAQASNPDFMFTTTCADTLQPGSLCTFQLVFAPHATGPGTGVLTIIDSVKSQPVQMDGTGTLANITLLPANLDFGATGVQLSSPAQTLHLANGSTGTMGGISIATTGPYLETDSCGTTLSSGATCAISVIFAPGNTGSQPGALTIRSVDVTSMTASLTGAGIAFTLSPTTPTSVSVHSGQAASFGLQLLPANGSIGYASLTCSNLPPNATCTINPATASLLTPTNIQVAVATGVGAAGSARIDRAAMAGSLPWPLGLWLIVLPLWRMHRRGKALRAAGWNHMLAFVLLTAMLVAAATGISACGIGGGPLGRDVPNPLPGSSLTPPGSYTVMVTAAAGDLQKSVSLVIQVQ
ncbi:MAG: choice-of-anchor D domain-containing protein, partial [Acidobacteriaceae bacterium]